MDATGRRCVTDRPSHHPAVAPGLSLPTLLSQALVAFTIEFDNEFEHRMPHRTKDRLVRGGGPWLVSQAMWTNFMRFVPPDGLPLHATGGPGAPDQPGRPRAVGLRHGRARSRRPPTSATEGGSDRSPDRQGPRRAGGVATARGDHRSALGRASREWCRRPPPWLARTPSWNGPTWRCRPTCRSWVTASGRTFHLPRATRPIAAADPDGAGPLDAAGARAAALRP